MPRPGMSMDRPCAILLLILWSPLLAVIVLLVALTSRGPLLYCEYRVGQCAQVFKIYKFRTMRGEKPYWTGEDCGRSWRQEGVDRRTRVGRVLRKTGLDELPQLWNVVKGQMALVGPRPPSLEEYELFRISVPLYLLRFQVKPGITGLAQVQGYRGDTSIQSRVEADLQYIAQRSPWADLRILFHTPTAIVRHHTLA